MRIHGTYESGNLVKFHMKYFGEEEKIHFREINLQRRLFQLTEIDPRDDVFVILMPPIKHEIKINGKLQQELFALIAPVKDQVDYRKLYTILESSNIDSKAWSFPVFELIPADEKDLNLLAKYISYTHACPYCSQKVEAHINNNKLRFLCKSILNGKHIYNFSQDHITGDYEITLSGDCVTVMYTSTNRKYSIKIQRQDELPMKKQINNTLHDKIYENLVKHFKFYIKYS